MNFVELQDAALSDRFSESKRTDAKRWINYRYGRLWSKEPWTFKLAVASYTLGSGQSTVALGNFLRIVSVWDDTTTPGYSEMDAIRPQDLYDNATRTSGTPIGFTVIGDNIRFLAPASSQRTYTVLGELKFQLLVDDSDEPLIPEEFHQVLVHGAISEGLRLENDPTWQAAEEDYKVGYEDMKGSYLTPVTNFMSSWPSWPAWA